MNDKTVTLPCSQAQWRMDAQNLKLKLKLSLNVIEPTDTRHNKILTV